MCFAILTSHNILPTLKNEAVESYGPILIRTARGRLCQTEQKYHIGNLFVSSFCTLENNCDDFHTLMIYFYPDAGRDADNDFPADPRSKCLLF